MTRLEVYASNVHGLRKADIYARELSNTRHEPSLKIASKGGEEILNVTDYGEYTEVARRTRGQSDALLYHVRREPRSDRDDRLRWVFMGKVDPDEV